MHIEHGPHPESTVLLQNLHVEGEQNPESTMLLQGIPAGASVVIGLPSVVKMLSGCPECPLNGLVHAVRLDARK